MGQGTRPVGEEQPGAVRRRPAARGRSHDAGAVVTAGARDAGGLLPGRRGVRGRGPARAKTGRAALLLGVAGALLVGCASMPDSGDVRAVEASQRPDSQVRVLAMPPREHAGPDEVVQGFLEALTSDDPHFEIARKYLTKEASRKWHPERSTTVLADGPNAELFTDRGGYAGGEGRQYSLKGHRLAIVDAQHAYQPRAGDYTEPVHLKLETIGGRREWRIDRPPSGIVLGVSDFQRIYQPVDKYYYAAAPAADASASAASPAPDGSDAPGSLVADPVYVRQRVDPVTQTLQALLDGPTRWLDPVVRTGFPAGTRLKAGVKGLEPDDQNMLRVPLNAKADRVGKARCRRMAAQVVFTLQDLTSAGITKVMLLRSDGSTLCELDTDGAEAIAPHRSVAGADYQYFLDSDHRLVRMATGGDPEPAPGPLGSGTKKLGKVAVSRDEARAAGVSRDGRELYVADFATRAPLGAPVLTSAGKPSDGRLTAPSWDGHGDLWVADRDPSRPRLLLLEHGTGNPVEVSTPWLDPGRIEAVRVAADGVRIALLVEEHGEESLYVGRIERKNGSDGPPDDPAGERAARAEHPADPPADDDADNQPKVTVAELRPGAPQMEQVTAMSWAGPSRLVVVGRESGGVQQVRYVQCDGSAPASGVLPGLTGVAEIAAADDDRLPLVALSDDGIVRMPPGAPWRTVGSGGDGGTSPVYPG